MSAYADSVKIATEDPTGRNGTCAVTQPWLHELPFMQQSVLLAAIRGPDGIRKDHVAKLLLRWFRRCVLRHAFDGAIIENPVDDHGGSFTGPSLHSAHVLEWPARMNAVVKDYLSCCDELPHHYQLHFLHAAEILGYKHPDPKIQAWWLQTYMVLVNDMHLYPENKDEMNRRLGDNEKNWRAREEVTAKGPPQG